jgi:hypothetical protein
MGAAKSRRRPGQSQTPQKTQKILGGNHPPPTSEYFILSYKGDRVKVVNASSVELKLVTAIMKQHCEILKEGWDRTMTFSYKVKVAGRHTMIQMVADTLLSLYQAGWEPMTPMDMGHKQEGLTSSICFHRRKGRDLCGSSGSIKTEVSFEDNSCLCLEIFQDKFLGFHNISHTVLLEIVTTVQREWTPGIRGVSMEVASVITDYTTNMPPVLAAHPQLRDEKYIQLEGEPWAGGQEDPVSTENLQLTIIACLTREGYKLSMDINMDTTSRVYFFIRDSEEQSGEVRVPNMSGAGLGEKDTLSVYRPLVVRSKNSFLRKHPGNLRSLRRKVSQKVRASLRRKAVVRQGRQDTVVAYKPTETGAWWQQCTTDSSYQSEED